MHDRAVQDGFAGAAIDVVRAETREWWTPLLAARWQPDTSENNGMVWDCLAEPRDVQLEVNPGERGQAGGGAT